jgi:hypothetical protein
MLTNEPLLVLCPTPVISSRSVLVSLGVCVCVCVSERQRERQREREREREGERVSGSSVCVCVCVCAAGVAAYADQRASAGRVPHTRYLISLCSRSVCECVIE